MASTWKHTKSRQERGYGAAWERARKAVMLRDCGLCQVCKAAGRVRAATEVDHMLPKSKGGTDDAENLQAICNPCHTDKTLTDEGKSPRPQIGADGWPVSGLV